MKENRRKGISPSPKRPRIVKDGILAESVLACSAKIDDDTDIPNTYAEAVGSDEAMAWREAMKTELLSHE